MHRYKYGQVRNDDTRHENDHRRLLQPRPQKTTYEAMSACLAAAGETEGVATRLIELAGMTIGPCLACGICREGLICGIDDGYGEIIEAFQDPTFAGLIVGTPVYSGMMTAQCKAFLDRSVVFRRNGWMLRDKVGGVLAVGGVRNGGQELTIQAVRNAMLCHDMISVSDGRPTDGPLRCRTLVRYRGRSGRRQGGTGNRP